jgi:hypothetical protein
VLLGVDGLSHDLLLRYAREGRLPHLASLLSRGSSGYLNSILWRRFERRTRGYFSPIVWSTIATGKRPDQHGIEDFVLPLPEARDFYLRGGGQPALLELAWLRPGALLIEASAAAPDSSVALEVRLGDRLLGRLSYTGEASVQTVSLPEDAPPGPARLVLRPDPPGAPVPLLRVRRLGLLDPAGRLQRWLHPRQNAAEMPGAWHYPAAGKQAASAASHHLLARSVWDIASGEGRRVHVVGWWATWPVQALHGSVFADLLGAASAQQAGRGLFQPPELQPLVDTVLQETAALQTRWQEELADLEGCQCLGPRQVQLYLEHRRVDELRVRLATELAAEPFDLMSVYVRLVDTAGHQFLGFEHAAALERCNQPGCNAGRLRTLAAQSYEILDEAVGRLLQAMPRDAVWIVVSDHGQLTGQDRPGVHQNNGVVLMAGPGIAPGVIFEAQVTDVAPTVLYLLDLPVASDMTGRVLTQALDPGLLQRFPPRYRATYEDLLAPLPRGSQALDEKLAAEQLEALEALGYME